MTKNVGYPELYQTMNDLRRETNEHFDKIEEMFRSFHKEEFTPIQRTIDRIQVYGALVLAVLSFVATGVWEWIRVKFIKT